MAVIALFFFSFLCFYYVCRSLTKRKKGNLWFPEDVFNIQAAVGWVSHSRARIVRTGAELIRKPPLIWAGLFGIQQGGKALVD